VSPSPEVRIGERLRFYRQAKGKTQAVVAGLAGVTEDYLSQIERGLKTPTLSLLHRFSKILGVRVSELLGESATEHDEAVNPVGYAVQRALMSYPAGSPGEPDLVSLRGRVDAAWSIWQGSPHRYTQASDVLPGLITDVQAAQRALRLSPRDPFAAVYCGIAAYAQYLGRNYDEAIRLSREALRQRHDFVGAHRVLTAAAGMAGQADLAQQALLGLRRAQPNVSLAWIAANMPIRHEDDRTHYLEGFRRAGLD